MGLQTVGHIGEQSSRALGDGRRKDTCLRSVPMELFAYSEALARSGNLLSRDRPVRNHVSNVG